MSNPKINLAGSKRQATGIEAGIQISEKAIKTGKGLVVDKKGDLRTRGFISDFFLRMKIKFMSKGKKDKYYKGQRMEMRAKVLDKLVDLAAQSKKNLILQDRGTIDENDLAVYLGKYKKVKKLSLENYTQYEQEDCNDKMFNMRANVLLKSESPTSEFAMPPTLPDMFAGENRPKLNADRNQLTQPELLTRDRFERATKLFKHSANEGKDDKPHVYDLPKINKKANSYGSRTILDTNDRKARLDKLTSKDNYTYPINITSEVIGTTPELALLETIQYSKPVMITSKKKDTLNIEDFRTRTEKRVEALAKKDKNLNEAAAANTVDAICYLRQEVQKKLVEGEAPDYLQSLFHVNSAMQLEGKAQPDCLIASKRLVAKVASEYSKGAGGEGEHGNGNQNVNVGNRVEVLETPNEGQRFKRDIDTLDKETQEMTEFYEAFEKNKRAPYSVDIKDKGIVNNEDVTEAVKANNQKNTPEPRNDLALAWIEFECNEFNKLANAARKT